jgi:GTP1/Obg family GTP-binding protein
MERRKEALIAACWANSNYDDDKGTRQSLIDEIEEHFKVATLAFLNGKDAREEEEYEIDENNPFWSSMKRGVEKVQTSHRDTNADVQAVIAQEEDYNRFIDQA